MKPHKDRAGFAEIDYSYTPSRVVCPCGMRRPEGFYQSDSAGNATGLHDRLCVIQTCSGCGRIITAEGVIIGQKEGADA